MAREGHTSAKPQNNSVIVTQSALHWSKLTGRKADFIFKRLLRFSGLKFQRMNNVEHVIYITCKLYEDKIFYYTRALFRCKRYWAEFFFVLFIIVYTVALTLNSEKKKSPRVWLLKRIVLSRTDALSSSSLLYLLCCWLRCTRWF